MLVDASVSSGLAPFSAQVVTQAGDPAATRTVYTTIIVLTVLGLVLAALAVWVFRRTRPERQLLAPLETMQTRRWRKLDPADRSRRLDEARPAGAVPLRREATVAAIAGAEAVTDAATEVATNADGEAAAGATVEAEVTIASSADDTIESVRLVSGEQEVATDEDVNDEDATDEDGEDAHPSETATDGDDTGEIESGDEPTLFGPDDPDDDPDDDHDDDDLVERSIDPLLGGTRPATDPIG